MACIHAFLYANKSIPQDVRKLFILVSEILVIECIEDYLDGRLGMFPHEDVAFWRILVSGIGYSVRPVMLHGVLLIMSRSLKWRPKYYLLAIPSCITWILCIMAFFTKWVFWYDENNVFHTGPLRYVIFGMLMVYFVIILVSAIVDFKKRGNESFVIIGIIILLLFDWILVLVYDDVRLHLSLEVLSVLLYFMYFVSVFNAKKIEEKEVERIESERVLTKNMLDQSIETLAYTIDAKDKYTRGHSSRVAKYARMIALVRGKTEEECREVYLAGLLHDIGKISVNSSIINKPGKLTDEEFEIIKMHPSYGARILKKMKSIPYLQDGAQYHHERYDGKGYPEGLKGEEIPELARIISVADAYDAMTSFRSYRPAMDQSDVKQELWKGIRTQFDPTFAKVMISLIDADVNYEMREIPGEADEIIFDDVDTKIEWPSAPMKQTADVGMLQETCSGSLAAFIMTGEGWFKPGEGFRVTKKLQRFSFRGVTKEAAKYLWSVPAVMIYSSEDGKLLGPGYDELGVFLSAGYGWQSGSTRYEYSDFTKNPGFVSWENWIERNKAGLDYTAEVQLENDMVVLTINNEMLRMDVRLALPENYSREVYITFTGERSDISEIRRLS